jgi:hypothetical protein
VKTEPLDPTAFGLAGISVAFRSTGISAHSAIWPSAAHAKLKKFGRGKACSVAQRRNATNDRSCRKLTLPNRSNLMRQK